MLSNVDAICITGPWLSAQTPDSAVAIPGFNLFRNDRTSTSGGGECFFKTHYHLHPIRAV